MTVPCSGRLVLLTRLPGDGHPGERGWLERRGQAVEALEACAAALDGNSAVIRECYVWEPLS